MPRKKQSRAVKKASDPVDLTDQMTVVKDYAARVLATAEQLGISEKVVDELPLDPAERVIIMGLPAFPEALRNEFSNRDGRFTLAETANIVLAIADGLQDGEPLKRLALLFSARKLADLFQANMTMPQGPAKVKKSKPTGNVFQFKITLLGIKPAIWRRIQVTDCTLDKLHENIQTAMGWTNSHLNQFDINGERYGDPELLDDGFEDFECVDSTKTMLSRILSKTGKRFSFKYEYDFGDGWEHEILFEGVVPADPNAKYPLCVEGARACPPEDCGGVWGYGDFLEAISNKKHKEHESMMEWAGGWFDPEEFDAATATKAMKKGLPDWRKMES